MKKKMWISGEIFLTIVQNITNKKIKEWFFNFS